jgi:hypothetical protein
MRSKALMGNIGNVIKPRVVILLLAILLSGCAGFAETNVLGPDGEVLTIDRRYFEAHADEMEGSDDDARLPLERALADSGYSILEQFTVELEGGGERAFPWEQVVDEAWILADGRISVEGDLFDVLTIQATTHPDLARVEASILDIAPTAARALGIRPPVESQGQVLDAPDVDHVLLLFLDGFGYLRYEQAKREGLIPNLADLDDALVGLTTYPPTTTVSTASLLTGAPPTVNGVDRRGIRITEIETLFDVASQSGLQVKAVEGEALAFQLRGAEFELSGDRNGNGMTDDEVLQNALEVLQEGVPDLFFVHFHGIDDAGHTYGPDTSEESEIVAFVDSAVGEILTAMPDDSLILIFADHGMHMVDEEGRFGNHEHLIPLDMLIPIIMVSK